MLSKPVSEALRGLDVPERISKSEMYFGPRQFSALSTSNRILKSIL